MEWPEFEARWDEFGDNAQARWRKLTDEDLITVGGRRMRLIGRVQRRYSLSFRVAKGQVEGWKDTLLAEGALPSGATATEPWTDKSS